MVSKVAWGTSWSAIVTVGSLSDQLMNFRLAAEPDKKKIFHLSLPLENFFSPGR